MNLSKRINRMLEPKIFSMVNHLGSLADKMDYKAYLVGGFVRDLLLNIKNLDIDIAVSGGGILFAKKAAGSFGASLATYDKFQTATLILKKIGKNKDVKVDIATLRDESYDYPASLPKVKSGTIIDDLKRRDFTINSMAVSISKNDFGNLIDFFGGFDDLKSKTVRVMHDKSFVDDPTRIFRAVRFEQRYGFKIEKRTRSLIKKAISLSMFDKVSGERLKNELVILLSEKDPLMAIKRMKELDELRFISPKVRFDKRRALICKNIAPLINRYEKSFSLKRWLIYFLALADSLSLKELESVCGKLMMSGIERSHILSAKRFEKNAVRASLIKKLKPSEVCAMLRPMSDEALIFLAAKYKSKTMERNLNNYVLKYRRIKLNISGADLKLLGLKPGPKYSKILNFIIDSKINGHIKTKSAERALAKEVIKRF